MARTNQPPLGPIVRRRRQQLGLTQADLAAAADIADETVSRIERGRLTPSVDIAERIARALGTTASALREAKAPKVTGTRPCDARLLAVVRDLDDTAVDDVVRAVKVLLAVGAKRVRK
jgi:transcriptional regulator with XRE-family HTH domain